MIPLNQIQVPKPCGENWDAMDGDAQRRFCADCGCHVHDLSAMTTMQAQSLLDQTDGRLCVRFQTRPNGTVLTQDTLPAPENRVFWPRRMAAAASWVLALVVAGLGLPLRADTSPKTTLHTVPKAHGAASANKKPRAMLGKIAAPRPLPMYTAGMVALPRVTPPPVPHATMGDVVTMGAPLAPPPPKK